MSFLPEGPVDEARIDEFWDWITVAFFLLITVDLFTSLAAAGVVGVQAESNPLMRWLLTRSAGLLVLIHLGVLVAATVGFHLVLGRLQRTPSPLNRYFALVIELWLGLLIAAGLGIFANNLSVIVLGRGLL